MARMFFVLLASVIFISPVSRAENRVKLIVTYTASAHEVHSNLVLSSVIRAYAPVRVLRDNMGSSELVLVEAGENDAREIIRELGSLGDFHSARLTDVMRWGLLPDGQLLHNAVIPNERLALRALERGDESSFSTRMQIIHELNASFLNLSRQQIERRFSEGVRNQVADKLDQWARQLARLYSMLYTDAINQFRFEHQRQPTPTDLEQIQRFADLTAFGKAIGRIAVTMDRLATKKSQIYVLRMLPLANFAPLSMMITNPQMRGRYFTTWINFIDQSVTETLDAIKREGDSETRWRLRQGVWDYGHLQGQRRLIYYNSRSQELPFDPAEMGKEAVVFLSVASPQERLRMVTQLSDLIVRNESKILEINTSYRERLAKEMTEPGEVKETIQGHTLVDGLVTSLAFSNRIGLVPGVSLENYLAAVIEIHLQIMPRLKTPEMVRMFTDVGFNIAMNMASNADVLKGNRSLARKAAQFKELLRANISLGGLEFRDAAACEQVLGLALR